MTSNLFIFYQHTQHKA